MNKSKLWFLILAWTSSVSTDDHFCSPCKPDVPADETSGGDKASKVACDCEKIGMTAKMMGKLQPNEQKVMDLFLNNNTITELTSDFFPDENRELWKKTREVTMNFCGIKTIAEDTFEHLTILQVLELSHNEIETLPEKLFESNTELSRIRLDGNRLHSIPHQLFHGLFKITSINLSRNFLHSVHRKAFQHNNEMHTINMSHNNLTKIESDWFESFHTNWQIGDSKQAGQVTMSGNPWICDCTTIAFIEFQDHNPWFKYQYDERSGYVDLGTCQYPRALRSLDFEGLLIGNHERELSYNSCDEPNVFDNSDLSPSVGRNDDSFACWVRVYGLPNPTVSFEVRKVLDNGTVPYGPDRGLYESDSPQITIEFHEVTSLDGPLVTHSFFPTFTESGNYHVIANIDGIDSNREPISQKVQFDVTVGGTSGGMKIFLIILIICLSFLIIWRYRSTLKDTWNSVRGKAQPMGMPGYAYANLPNHSDQNDGLIDNEYRPPSTEPTDMKINV